MTSWSCPRLLGFGVLLVLAAACSPRLTPVVSHLTSVDGELMLIGTIDQEELLRNFSSFKACYDQYRCDSARIDSLRRLTRKIHVEVYLGTWCGDSKHHVSSFLRIMNEANNDHITYSMIGLDRTKKDAQGLASQRQITLVPTMIFLEEGIEIGRITENPFGESIEEDICGLLKP